MKVTLEPTSMFTAINGVPCRVWQGLTEGGIPIHAHIALVGVDNGYDPSELVSALREVAAPRADIAAIPLRMLVDVEWSE